MSGKCRPSLRKKTIMVVMQSDFSKAVKECIAEVFARYESMIEKSEKTEVNAIEKSMTMENCDKCKVGRWYYDMFGELLCENNCPYTGSTKIDKKGENDD